MQGAGKKTTDRFPLPPASRILNPPKVIYFEKPLNVT
jgi:hypothetical protein